MNTKLKQIHIEELRMADQQKAHPAEELLERYALERLAEPELGELEEHLLLCAHCQERLDETTEYVLLMQEAAAKVAAEVPAEAAWKKWFRMDWLPGPAPALAGAFVMLLAISVWQPWRPSAPNEWRTVELATLRGGGTDTGAAEGFALRMRLDVSGLEIAGLAAQIVHSNGAVVAEAPVGLADGKAELQYAAGLTPGQYWVRLRKDGETVREYSLTVKRR